MAFTSKKGCIVPLAVFIATALIMEALRRNGVPHWRFPAIPGSMIIVSLFGYYRRKHKASKESKGDRGDDEV